MIRPLLKACVFPFSLSLAVLCCGARFSAAAGEPEDNIPARKLVEQVHPAFVQAQGKYTDENMPRIIGRIDKQFGEKIMAKGASYSDGEVNFVKQAVPYSIDFAKTVKETFASSDRPEVKRQKIEEAKARYNDGIASLIKQEINATTQRMRDAGDSNKKIGAATKALADVGQHFAMPLLPSGPPKSNASQADPAATKTAGETAVKGKEAATSGDGSAGPPDSNDKADLGKTLLESVRGAFGRGDHPDRSHGDGNASLPSMGEIIGLPTNNSSPSSAMAGAGDQLMKGNIDGALAAASRAVDMGGGAEALAFRGGIQLDDNQYSKAAQDARQALQMDPSNQEAAAILHFAEGRSDGVASDGPTAVKAGNASSGAGGAGGFGGGYGGGYRGNASMENASAQGGAAERLAGLSNSMSGPGGRGGPSGAALAGLSADQAHKAAQSAMSVGDVPSAMAYVNRALAQDPKNPSLLSLRASAFNRQRDYAKAEADARAGLAGAPRDPMLLRALGFAQLRQKDYQGALATANKMLELNPNDPYAYALRAHAYGSLGDRDAMLADLKRAAELDPNFRKTAAEMESRLQLPTDQDLLFLFPGEEGAAGAKPAAPAAGRGRLFGLLVGASVLGGLLVALGLLHTVLAPLKDKVTSAFTRITRTGPTVGAEVDNETLQPASAGGLLPGLIRGQYEIVRQIGQGGMGTVFEGTDRSLGRRVAIKKMREELKASPQERGRFVIEAKTVAALHHPGIVDIYSIAEEGPDVFLVFEYVDGKTVHDILQSSGRLPVPAAVGVVRAAADALGFAHSRGVIHRDMKPSNVMVDSAGRVKVMDFGIARMAKDSATRYSMTNTVVGTPPYMAPEQERGQVRKESDVYALAVCAYEMLTGKLPFAGIGAGMLMNKMNMSFVPPSRATAGLPEALDPVFAKAFQADADLRYRTPQEFADALQAALPGSVPA